MTPLPIPSSLWGPNGVFCVTSTFTCTTLGPTCEATCATGSSAGTRAAACAGAWATLGSLIPPSSEHPAAKTAASTTKSRTARDPNLELNVLDTSCRRQGRSFATEFIRRSRQSVCGVTLWCGGEEETGAGGSRARRGGPPLHRLDGRRGRARQGEAQRPGRRSRGRPHRHSSLHAGRRARDRVRAHRRRLGGEDHAPRARRAPDERSSGHPGAFPRRVRDHRDPRGPRQTAGLGDEGPHPLLDLLFLVAQIEEDVLSEADCVLLGEVDPAGLYDRFELFDGRVGHPDHRLGLAQDLFALGFRELRASLKPLLVLLEMADEVPYAHRGGL